MSNEDVKKREQMEIDILIVSEDYSEDGNDRSSTVEKGILYALRGFMSVEANKSDRENFTPTRIGEIVAKSGCLVVLCDVYRDEEKTPKTHAALAALSPEQPWCYVLPLSEQRPYDDIDVGRRCKLVEEAAVMLVEHVANKA